MSRITISVRTTEPNVALVVALRRVTGTGIGDLATAVAQGTPLIDEDVFTNPTSAQLAKLRGVLALLGVASIPVFVKQDGRDITEHQLLESLIASEAVLAKNRAAADVRRKPVH